LRFAECQFVHWAKDDKGMSCATEQYERGRRTPRGFVMSDRPTRTAALRAVGFLFLWFGLARAEDWPTHLHDNSRSGVSGETLAFPLVRS